MDGHQGRSSQTQKKKKPPYGGFKLFTTKSSRTGEGQAIVKRLVQAHDGQTTLENAAGGIRATVVYPSVVRRALA